MRILWLAPLAGLAFALTACGGGGGSSSLVVAVSINPTSITVPVGGTEQFSVAVSNTSNTAVNWTVTGTGNVGTVSSTGIYTAPATIPSPATVTVTATSQADSTKSASATVTIVAAGQGGYSNASLKGNYVFSFSDTDVNNYTSFGAGEFTADGNGNITSGVEDINQGSTGFQSKLALQGTYSIQADGRGTLTLAPTGGVSFPLKFIMLADGSARFIVYSASLTGGGTIEPQTITNLSNASLAGNYVFSLSGDTANGVVATAGQMTLDANGNITSGTEDSNDSGTVASGVNLTGTYVIDSSGRGTATMTSGGTTSNFVFYVVNPNQIRLVESDFPTPATQGVAYRQTASSYTASMVKGGYVFATTGIGTSAYIDEAGQFNADGSGNISSGAVDLNNLGTTANGSSLTGNYTMGSNGRALINLSNVPTANGSPNTAQLAVYFADATHAVIVGLNSSEVTSGNLWAQTGSSFTLAGLKGSYGVRMDGFNVSSAGNTQPYSLSLQMSVDNAGNANGSEDITNNGTINTGVGASGTFTMSSNGRGTLALNDASGASQFTVYQISSTQFVLVGMDNFQLLIGTGQSQ